MLSLILAPFLVFLHFTDLCATVQEHTDGLCGRRTFELFWEPVEFHLPEDGTASHEVSSDAPWSQWWSSACEMTGLSGLESSNIGSFLVFTAQCTDCKQMTGQPKSQKLQSALKTEISVK